MIEDPRDIERKRTLGIEDPDEITRDDLADALVEVHHRLPAMCYFKSCGLLKVNNIVLCVCKYCGLVTGLLIHLYEIFYAFYSPYHAPLKLNKKCEYMHSSII
jgi:hypothetical protein